ncbi:hypothetical protein EYZ11_009206 [Aspergillus tanneri]|uniref:Transcription factor domain-containing protein n=1 Tax=Aspergillus tanneri TaxID=1220188 RepID=A0A4S3JDZ5_9EURO|nr:hypothetical protein EYZ11_009206 [Aspergillus tanneri]
MSGKVDSARPDKVQRALGAAIDALGYLARPATGSNTLDFTYVDRLLSAVVEPPSQGKQKNGRRGIAVIRQWMVEDGPGVALLEILGQLLWRVVDMNSEQLECLRSELHAQPRYHALIYDPCSAQLVLQRLERVRLHKEKACMDLRASLVGFSTDSAHSDASSAASEIERPYSADCGSVISDSASTNSEPLSWDPVLSYNGLIKLRPATINYRGLWSNEMERDLLDFYINMFAPSQTLFAEENAYLTILPLALHSESTRNALFSVSASYMREYALSDAMKYGYMNHNYMVLAAQALQRDLSEGHGATDSCLAAGMLLVHHGVVNENETEMCWSWHVRMIDGFQQARGGFDPSSEPALFMNYQLTLALTAQTSAQIQAQRFGSSDWLLQCSGRESQRICGILGMSRRMLSMISRITMLGTAQVSDEERVSTAESLDDEIAMMNQWCYQAPGEALEVALQTAQAYQLAARIYLLCRVLGATPLHSQVASLHAKLYDLVMRLPIDGMLYTAAYPLWCCFIAALTSGYSEKTEILYERLNSIRTRNKGNICAVISCISSLFSWIHSHPFDKAVQHGWWDALMETQPARMRLLSLG